MSTSSDDVRAADRRQGAWMLLIAGPIAVVVGVVAGLTHVWTAGEDCGSPLAPTSRAGLGMASAMVDVSCEDTLSGRRALTWVLLVLGAAATIAGAVLVARLRATSRPPAPVGVSAELARLAELHDVGALTDEEWAAAKSQVLGAPPG